MVSSAVNKSFPFNKIAPVEGSAQMGWKWFFQEVVAFSSNIELFHMNSHWKYDLEKNNLELLDFGEIRHNSSWIENKMDM